MPLGTGLRTLLVAETTITDLVTTTGVFVGAANQSKTEDYIVIDVVETDFHPTLQADTIAEAGGKEKSVNFDCVSKTYVTADAIANALTAFIDDYSGAITGGTDTINQVLLVDQYDSEIPPANGEGLPEFVVTVVADILYEET